MPRSREKRLNRAPRVSGFVLLAQVCKRQSASSPVIDLFPVPIPPQACHRALRGADGHSHLELAICAVQMAKAGQELAIYAVQTVKPGPKGRAQKTTVV